jgi:hypothetical protein
MSREDTTNKKGKPHRDRKNPHAASEFKKQRHERNVSRGPQSYFEVSKTWVRNAIRQEAV